MALPIIQIIFGGLLVFLGRRLFWLFAAIAGFFFGIQLGNQLGAAWPTWMQLLAAIGLGVVMAVLAVASLRLASMVVGFLAGWVIMAQVLTALGLQAGTVALILNLLAGVVGAALALAFFDLAVIVLSALAGATTIVSSLAPLLGLQTGNLILLAVGGVLAVVGIIFQMREMETHPEA